MEKNHEFTILVLQLIKFNGNTNYLVFQEYSHTQIIDSLKFLIAKKYAISNPDRLELTTKGETYLMDLNKKLNRKGLYRYMSPMLKYKIKKMDINEIYVPLLPNWE